MTDDLMDARLHGAGERWRAAHPDPAEVSPPAPRARRRPPWALLISAAVVVAALVVGLVLISRGGDTPPASKDLPLAGTVWRLAGYGAAPERSLATLTVSGGTLVASDSCSLLTARAATHGATITFAALTVRAYGCTDSVGDGPQFDRLALFRGDARWTVDGARLTLTRGAVTAHLVVAADGTPPPTADYPTLTDTAWRLVSATDATGHQHLIDSGVGATLRIAGGRLTAGDTCNTLSASATVTGPTIRFGTVTSTGTPCPTNPAIAVVDAVLSGSVTTTVRANELIVTSAGAGHLDYVWVPQHDDTSALTGRTWTLSLVAGERAAVRAMLRFDAQDSHLTGSDGCRSVGATARITPGALTVTGVGATPKTCPAQTTTVDSFLTQPATLWRIVAGRLVLYGGGAQAFALVFTTSKTPPAHERSR